MKPKRNISFKLTLGFVSIALLSMLTIGLIFINVFRQNQFASHEKTLFTRARSIAGIMSDFSQGSGPMRGFGGFIRFLDTMAEASVWITDPAGNPINFTGGGMGMANEHPLTNPSPLPLEARKMMSDVLLGKESVTRSFSSLYNEATLTVGVPIMDSQKNVLGSVLLHAPITGVTQTYDTAVRILMVSVVVALILAILLGMIYSLQFTKPLTAMNQSALEMAGGNYSIRTGIHQEDEIGQLGSSLDFLAAKLQNTMDELFQEEGKLHDIIANVSEGIFSLDTNMRPISFNHSLETILGKASYCLVDLERDLTLLGLKEPFEQVINERSMICALRDWQGKRLRLTLSPILDNQAVIKGSVVSVQDITESEQLEQFRKDFVANVSHEFRTPLTVIRGTLEALIDGTLINDPKDHTYLNRLLAETRGLERLVKDLLELSRLQSGKISIHREPVDIASLFEDIIKNLAPLSGAKDIDIKCNVASSPLMFKGDYDRLRQLFVIFLDNAIKYSPPSKAVTIDVQADAMLTVSISDQGYGILASDLPYIWDRFYKADKSRKSEGKGTGLGLSIAKYLIELFHGTVQVKSTPEEGSLFTICLPITD